MKRLFGLLTLVVCVGVLATGLRAQDAPKPKENKEAKPAASQKLRMGPYYAQMIKVCALTDEQKKKLETIMTEREQALTGWDAKNAEKEKTLK